MIVSICGVCCVLQPWRSTFRPSLTAALLGYTVAVASGIFQALDILFFYWFPFLWDRDNQYKIMFWSGIIGTCISIAMAVMFEDIQGILHLSWQDWLLVFGHGAAYAADMLLFMYTCSVLPGTLTAIISSTMLIYVSIAQYTFLSHIHKGNHNWVEILGICLVIISSTFPSIIKARQKDS